MIWATVSSRSCFCWLYGTSLSLAAKKNNQSDFCIGHLVMSMCRVFSCVVGRGYLLWPMFSWQNPVILCPASFCTLMPNLPVTPGISWLPTFAFQSPIMTRTSFGLLVLEGLVYLHRTIQLQLLQHYWLGHRLGLLCYWMICLRNEQRSFSCFWDCIQVWTLSFIMMVALFSKGFLPTVVDIMVIWVSFMAL